MNIADLSPRPTRPADVVVATHGARPDAEPRRRVLLIAPYGSYRTGAFINAARRQQTEIVIATQDRCALVGAHTAGLHIDMGDEARALQTILAQAGRTPFCAVIGTDDASTSLAACASAALALAHNPLQAVRTARRKDWARACLATAGVTVPPHRCIDLRKALAPQLAATDFPCVVKPVALSASRGVIRANTPQELQRAIVRIQAILARVEQVAEAEERHLLLVEKFISGSEVAVEGLLTAGRLQLLAIFDKPDPLEGPYFEETYYVTPSRHSTAVQQRIAASVQAACAAYGLREGPVHAECRLNTDGVWILEVAARTIGGLCGRLLRFGTGYGLEELVLAHALGLPVTTQSATAAAGVLMIPIPQAGILRRVEGVLAAGRVPYIDDVIIDVREGNELVPLPEGGSYLGFIFAHAPTPAAAEMALRAAHACLRIVVAPLWKGRQAATVVSGTGIDPG
jgi:biotin carboxylase